MGEVSSFPLANAMTTGSLRLQQGELASLDTKNAKAMATWT